MTFVIWVRDETDPTWVVWFHGLFSFFLGLFLSNLCCIAQFSVSVRLNVFVQSFFQDNFAIVKVFH